jgi:hypothetical protein
MTPRPTQGGRDEKRAMPSHDSAVKWFNRVETALNY